MLSKKLNLNGAIKNAPRKELDTGWYRLRLFSYFRCVLALFFITLYLNGWLQKLIPPQQIHTTLFLLTAAVYLTASVIFIFAIIRKQPSLETQVLLQTVIDISIIILLMHATGGVRTGLGMLLIISTSMTSLFLKTRLSFLFAAIATLSVLGEQIISDFSSVSNQPDFTQTGMLGLLIFTSVLLTTYIARHLHASEQLAKDKTLQLESVVQMNQHIIHSMRTGILMLSNNGNVLMSNNAATELLDIKPISTHLHLKDISSELHLRFLEWSKNNIQNHRPIIQKNGLPDIQPGFSQINQTPEDQSKTLVFLENATQLTLRFQQVKLASLGRLTASIAHEIRNPLAAINHAGQLLSESSHDPADKKLTRIINTQTKRLNSIVENVLQLSRQQRGNIETINLSNWLQQFREEFYTTHGLKAEQIHAQIKPQTLNILFDPTQLHQVLWNLCSNAINHAGLDSSSIIISIHSSQDDKLTQPCIDIIDNGSGIDKATQTHIFEPFFTTSAKGTGLGLYITREVIETNHAKIRYIELPTGGTCFRIYFMEATDKPQRNTLSS